MGGPPSGRPADERPLLATPHHAGQGPGRLERRIIKLRYLRRWGPHRIGYHLGAPRSTVGRVLARCKMPLLAHVDQATGLPVRRPKPVRYEASAPGDLVHVDIKKLGRIPAGGGWRVFGRGSEQDRRSGAAAFWQRARAFFADAGIAVRAVMTDNGSCYRSGDFAKALGPDVKHRWTRPYRPQTNGKVERFNRTLATEWAYAQVYLSDEARAATYPGWLHFYNHHRPHAGGLVPAARVHNVTGNYT